MRRWLLTLALISIVPLAALAQTRLSGPWTASTGLSASGSVVTAIASIPGPVRVFVATTGNDANTCLTVSVPCATLARALTAGTAMLNSNGGSLYIKMAAGSYTQSLFVNGPLTGMINSAPNPNGTNAQPGQVVIEGDGSTTTTLTGNASNCAVIASSNYANVAVRALRLVGTGVGCQSTLFAQMAGTIHGLDDLDFGPASVEHIHLENGGQFQGWFSYKVSGGGTRHITAGQSSTYLHSAFPTGVITFTGTPTFSLQFAYATQASTIQWNTGVSFVSTFVGTRYAVESGGNIQTPSTSLTWLPGTVAGFSRTGGVYTGPASSTIVGAVKANGDGTYQHAVCADLSDDGTACTANTGTSGTVLPFLDGANTWSGTQTFGSVLGTVVTESTTSRTVSAADCGKTIRFTNAGAITYTTLNTVPVGCAIGVLQASGAGQVTIANGASATSLSAHSFTKTFAAGAILGLFVDVNAGGSAANYIITGDGA